MHFRRALEYGFRRVTAGLKVLLGKIGQQDVFLGPIGRERRQAFDSHPQRLGAERIVALPGRRFRHARTNDLARQELHGDQPVAIGGRFWRQQTPVAALGAERPAHFRRKIVLQPQFLVAADDGRDFLFPPVVAETLHVRKSAGAGGKGPAHRSVETQAAGRDHLDVVRTRRGQDGRVAVNAHPTEIRHEEIANVVHAPTVDGIVVDEPLVAEGQGIILAAPRHQVPAEMGAPVADQQHLAPRMAQDPSRHLVSKIEL